MSSIRQLSVTARECFESMLAAIILRNPHYFSAGIDKVSKAIIDLLTHKTNSEFLARHNIISDDVIKQLYSNTHFGKLGGSISYCPEQRKFIKTVIDVLADENNNLPLIMHIHQIFMQSIYEKLPYKSNHLDASSWEKLKQSLVEVIFVNELFTSPSRTKTGAEGALTQSIGIASDNQCMPPHTTEWHQTVLGVFAPTGKWKEHIERHKLPYVAGPSGHAGSTTLLVNLLNLDKEEYKQVMTALIGILTGGGYHTVDEIMTVANKTRLGGHYHQHGNYHQVIPKDFLCSPEMMALATQYPQYLPTTESQCLKPVTSLFDVAGHGFIRGIVSSIYPDERHLRSAFDLKRTTSHFLMLLSYQFLSTSLKNANATTPDSYLQLLINEAIYTGKIMVVDIVLTKLIDLVEQARKSLHANNHNTSSQVLGYTNSLLNLGIFAYSAVRNGVTQILPAMVIGAATENITKNCVIEMKKKLA